jgi:hypothetical protein
VYCCNRRLVLLLGATLELVNDAISHGSASFRGIDPGPWRAARESLGGVRFTLCLHGRSVDGQTH